jgi:hypothetical protein
MAARLTKRQLRFVSRSPLPRPAHLRFPVNRKHFSP